MSWPFPPTVNTKLNTWEFLRQFPRALIQRAWFIGSQYSPDCSHAWAEGTITGMTETSMTDSTATWDNTKNQPWAGVNLNTEDRAERSLPTTWTLVIDSDDPDEVIITDITAIAAHTLTIDNIRDFLTSKFSSVSSVSDLIGRNYAVIRGDRPLWWSQRLMQTPNSYEFAAGAIVTLPEDNTDPNNVLPASPTTSLIRDTTKNWKKNELAGKHILFYAADGFLKRRLITSNTRTVVNFSTSDSLATTAVEYIVLAANGKGYPGRADTLFQLWYSGYMEGYKTHSWDDQLISVNMPKTLVHISGSNDAGTDCTGYDVQAWDRDVFTEQVLSPEDAACGGLAEEFHSPNIYNNIRGMQLFTEQLSSGFVADIEYEDEPWVPILYPAGMFKKASVNSYDTAITSLGSGTSDNTVNINSVGAPSYPVNCYWIVYDSRGKERSAGTGVLNSSTNLTAYSPDTDAFNTLDVGNNMCVSLGWDRYEERQFKYQFYRTGFVADYTCDGFGCSAIDPPATDFVHTGCDGVGQWVRRAPSTKYISRTITGADWAHTAQGFANETGHDFVELEMARYMGDNATDTCVRDLGGSPSQETESTNPQLTYFDRFYVGHHPPVAEGVIVSHRKGIATTDCDSFYITDSSKHLWYEYWMGSNSPLRIDSGTATSGTTTSWTCSSKTSGEPNCWWADARFNGFDSPWQGFTFEILISGTDFTDPNAVIAKRIITSGNASTGTVNWSQPLTVSANGKKGRFREPPCELNKFEGRVIQLTSPEGELYTSQVVGNDDQTIFFTSIGRPVQKSWTYNVIEPTIGDVFLRSGEAWVPVPVGDDSVRVGAPVPQPFHQTQNQNLPTIIKSYGKMFPADRICYTTFKQLYDCINVLTAYRVGTVWDNPDHLDNIKTVQEFDDDDVRPTWANLWTDPYTNPFTLVTYPVLIDDWAAASATYISSTAVPFALAYGANRIDPTKIGSFTKQTNLAKATIPAKRGLATRLDYYVFGTIDSADHDDGGVCTGVVNLDIHGTPYTTHSYQQYVFNGNVSGENIKFRAMHKWYAESAPSTDAIRFSTFCGDDVSSQPPVPADPAASAGSCLVHPTPPNNDYSSETNEGWYAYQAYAVVRGAVTGGLTYIA